MSAILLPMWRLQTYTAKETTVYRTIETTALAVREEHAVSGPAV